MVIDPEQRGPALLALAALMLHARRSANVVGQSREQVVSESVADAKALLDAAENLGG
jgi:hypothetical protein